MSNVSPVVVGTLRQTLMYAARKGRVQCCDVSLKIATWNIEGLSDLKIIELQRYMLDMDIDLICLQETHIPGAEAYPTEEGFFIVLHCCCWSRFYYCPPRPAVHYWIF